MALGATLDLDVLARPRVVRAALGVAIALAATGSIGVIAKAPPAPAAARPLPLVLEDQVGTTPTSAPRVGALDVTSAAPASIRNKPTLMPLDVNSLGNDSTPVTGGYTDLIRSYFGPVTAEALFIVACESHFVPWAVGNNTNGTHDHGLFQINDVHAAAFTAVTGEPWETGRYEPEPNTRFARWLYDRRGWAAWTCGRQMLDTDGGAPTKAPAETADGPG